MSFSIENRIMINAKRKRLEKSRENNPLWTGNKMKRKKENMNEEVATKKLKTENVDEFSKKPYAGMIGKPGVNKLRSKHNLKTQAIVHNRTIKKEKKIKKSSKKLDIKRKQKINDKNKIKVNIFKISILCIHLFLNLLNHLYYIFYSLYIFHILY